MSSNPPTIFLSYSHRDERLKERLATHLSALQGRLDVWDDRKLRAGDDWVAEIEKAIATADVAVLLISADFLSSDFISREEVPRLLKRRETEGVSIVPVLLKGCAWKQIPWLEAMQIYPADVRPLINLRAAAREDALADIATEVLQLAEAQRAWMSRRAPDPSYPDAPSQQLAEALEMAYRQHEELVSTGLDASATLETILDLKRRLRLEGQLKPGDYLAEGRYRLLEVLGSGGFAVVFKAYDRQSRGLVAVKVLHAQYAQDRSRRDRFFRGARKMGELQHQAIVRVIEPEAQDEGYQYFVMEYLEGGDLRQAVKAGQIDAIDGLALLDEVAQALDLAHRRGVIHRDVKPANILLTAGGQAKLTDFDLVRALDTTAGTRTGSMLGTFLYMAPEAMMAAEQADAAADVYSLAMCAAFVLHGDEIPTTFLRAYEAFFEDLQVSDHIKATLRRATSLKPSKRFGSAVELCTILSQGLALQAVAQPAPEPPATPPDIVVLSEWQSGQDSYGEWQSFEVDRVVQRLRWIPAGKFMMGSPFFEAGTFDNEGPQHAVTLTQGFWLAETACTQALWEAVMGDNPSEFKSSLHPVENVSWGDCQQFIERLNSASPGLRARLPTEAEWEYACRAGAKDAPILDSTAWYSGSCGRRRGPREVAQKTANPWGLYDMLGNVYEWCADWFGPYQDGHSEDPTGHRKGSLRVVRGGSWGSGAQLVRAAGRGRYEPGRRYDYLGFRLALGPGLGAWYRYR